MKNKSNRHDNRRKRRSSDSNSDSDSDDKHDDKRKRLSEVNIKKLIYKQNLI